MKKLINLFIQLQKIDSGKDAIENKKGSLPKELAKLEDQLQNLNNKLKNSENEASEQTNIIDEHKKINTMATDFIVKYKQEHLNTINNKEEYNNITKEIALQELDIQLAKKKIKIAQTLLNNQDERIEEIQRLIQENKEITQLKKRSLAEINETTKDREDKLDEQRKKLISKIQDIDLLQKYESLRKRFPLVVACVEQEACNGCFIIVPIQKQISIREGKELFMCENCDRMLVKAEKPLPQEKKTTRNPKTIKAFSKV